VCLYDTAGAQPGNGSGGMCTKVALHVQRGTPVGFMLAARVWTQPKWNEKPDIAPEMELACMSASEAEIEDPTFLWGT
jgi:hypothetical protein